MKCYWKTEIHFTPSASTNCLTSGSAAGRSRHSHALSPPKLILNGPQPPSIAHPPSPIHIESAFRLPPLGAVGSPICEPLPGEMGLGGYYGHYQGHWLSATAFLINSTANATVKAPPLTLNPVLILS